MTITRNPPGQFFVTYCVMDRKLANVFGHACIVLSHQPNEDEKIAVEDTWGFYPAPMAKPDSVIGKIKKNYLGLTYDLRGNYGELKKEEIRFLDLGYGLWGVTFVLDRKQYLLLKKICEEMLAAQEAAKEAAKARLANPNSKQLYEEEKKAARESSCAPRLQNFDFPSRTCKTVDIEILKMIGIPQAQLDVITSIAKSLPTFSGPLEPIFFHSTGPRLTHLTKSKGLVFFRDREELGTQLFWTFPPQHLISGSEELVRSFTLSNNYIDAIRDVINKLQKIEHVVVNTPISSDDECYRMNLIDHICSLYSAFSTMTSKESIADIQTKIAAAKGFLNRIYFAINDQWEDEDEVETIAAKFPDKAQKQICNILGRGMAKCTPPTFRAHGSQ